MLVDRGAQDRPAESGPGKDLAEFGDVVGVALEWRRVVWVESAVQEPGERLGGEHERRLTSPRLGAECDGVDVPGR